MPTDRMSLLPTIAHRHRFAEGSLARSPGIPVAAGLVVLLTFATATAFVRDPWPTELFELCAFLLLAAYLILQLRDNREATATEFETWLLYLAPVWGSMQIIARWTVSAFDTRNSALRWAALAAVCFLSQQAGLRRQVAEAMVKVFFWIATILALLCLLQMFTSAGRVLWIFSTGYPDVYGTFPSYNNHAQLIELALPIGLWHFINFRPRAWWYALACGFQYASVIASASRAGAAICTAEWIALAVFGLVRWKRLAQHSPRYVLRLVAVLILAIGFAAVPGWKKIIVRYKGTAPDVTRTDFLRAAIDMTRARPLTGFGLGTYPLVFPQYAAHDLPYIANHVHNDWAEFAAEGGIPFLIIIAVPCFAAVPYSIRHPWGLGLPAIMVHAFVDFPFARVSVSGWLFMILGLVHGSRALRRSTEDAANGLSAAHSNRAP